MKNSIKKINDFNKKGRLRNFLCGMASLVKNKWENDKDFRLSVKKVANTFVGAAVIAQMASVSEPALILSLGGMWLTTNTLSQVSERMREKGLNLRKLIENSRKNISSGAKKLKDKMFSKNKVNSFLEKGDGKYNTTRCGLLRIVGDTWNENDIYRKGSRITIGFAVANSSRAIASSFSQGVTVPVGVAIPIGFGIGLATSYLTEKAREEKKSIKNLLKYFVKNTIEEGKKVKEQKQASSKTKKFDKSKKLSSFVCGIKPIIKKEWKNNPNFRTSSKTATYSAVGGAALVPVARSFFPIELTSLCSNWLIATTMTSTSEHARQQKLSVKDIAKNTIKNIKNEVKNTLSIKAKNKQENFAKKGKLKTTHCGFLNTFKKTWNENKGYRVGTRITAGFMLANGLRYLSYGFSNGYTLPVGVAAPIGFGVFTTANYLLEKSRAENKPVKKIMLDFVNKAESEGKKIRNSNKTNLAKLKKQNAR